MITPLCKPAVEVLRPIRTRGHDTADVETFLEGFGFDDPPPFLSPGPGLVHAFVPPSDLLPGLFPLILHALSEWGSQRIQAVVAGQTDGIGDVLVLKVVVARGQGKP